METLNADSGVSFAVLILYLQTVCAAAVALKYMGIKIA